MAVTFDAASSAPGNGTTTVTWSHTTAGANRYLVVLIDPLSAGASAVTYNGVSMTKLGTTGLLWGLVAPATGANNVVATLASALAASDFLSALSFAGVDQSIPVGSPSGVSIALSATTMSIGSPSLNTDGLIASITRISSTGQVVSVVSGTMRVQGNSGLNYAQSATQVGGTPSTSWSVPGGPELWGAICVLVLPVSGPPATGTGAVCILKKIYRSVVAMVLRRKIVMNPINRRSIV